MKLIILDRDGRDQRRFGAVRQVARGMEADPRRAGGDRTAQTSGAGGWWWRPISPASAAGCSAWTRSTPSTTAWSGASPRRAGGSTASSSVRTRPTPPATAASPSRACLQIAERFNVELADVHPCVGDGLRDLQAAAAAGACNPMAGADRQGAKPRGERRLAARYAGVSCRRPPPADRRSGARNVASLTHRLHRTRIASDPRPSCPHSAHRDHGALRVPRHLSSSGCRR